MLTENSSTVLLWRCRCNRLSTEMAQYIQSGHSLVMLLCWLSNVLLLQALQGSCCFAAVCTMQMISGTHRSTSSGDQTASRLCKTRCCFAHGRKGSWTVQVRTQHSGLAHRYSQEFLSSALLNSSVPGSGKGVSSHFTTSDFVETLKATRSLVWVSCEL